ncbi:DUF6891 domain-containing protein [Flavobacterium album]|uniref:DUF6891 domain-containing protein n=1 Tax=Flavobacterium album TaxID=2175091 RepID=UPI0011B1C86E|nr:hypothetical protein [Flavobacterium album]
MEKLEDYKEDIDKKIKSGFFGSNDIISSYSEIGLDREELEGYVKQTAQQHAAAAQVSANLLSLQKVFDELSAEGYITLHKAGFTSSDAYEVIDEVLAETNFKPYGYILYNEQDLNRCLDDGELTLSFGAFRDTEQTQSNGKNKAETGAYFQSKLEEAGFVVDWDGSPDRKITLLGFDFKNYFDGTDWYYTRSLAILNKKAV